MIQFTAIVYCAASTASILLLCFVFFTVLLQNLGMTYARGACFHPNLLKQPMIVKLHMNLCVISIIQSNLIERELESKSRCSIIY